MTAIVLVHGAAHGGWCWEKLRPYLEADDRVDTVLAVDLSGHGQRQGVKPIEEISLQDYCDDVVNDITNLDLHDVVLLGHSLAGATITCVAHRIAQRLRRLIYLSTSNPLPGKTFMDLMQEHPLSPLSRGLNAEQMFCNDLDEDTTTWLLSRLGAEPMAPMLEKISISAAPREIPSTYILLEQDAALPPDYQREQALAAAVDEVIPFNAGHSAFASRPADLAELLLRYV